MNKALLAEYVRKRYKYETKLKQKFLNKVWMQKM